MKKLIFFVGLILCFACSKDDDNQSLPPATQSGAGTFACYVNGKPYVTDSNGWFDAYYEFAVGEYFFAVGGREKIDPVWSIKLETFAKSIEEGETLQLVGLDFHNASARIDFFTIGSIQHGTTNQTHTGELVITKLDFEEHIVSGTFWFDVKNPFTGELVEVREGRFDTHFVE